MAVALRSIEEGARPAGLRPSLADRLLTSAGFRSWAGRFPLTRPMRTLPCSFAPSVLSAKRRTFSRPQSVFVTTNTPPTASATISTTMSSPIASARATFAPAERRRRGSSCGVS